MTRTLFALLIVSQVACSQILIGVKAPKSIATVTAPSVPSLLTPADGVDSVSTTLTLAWSPSDSADTYTVNLSTSTTFSTLVVNWTTTGTSAAVSGLDSGALYYWRVRATNTVGSSAWSDTNSFTTITGSVPSAPTLVSPVLTDSVEIAPLLTWNILATATSYRVQLSNSGSFLSLLLDTTLSGTSVQLDTLSYNTLYYWRVRGTNSWGTGAYSSTSFTTTPLISIVRPAPVSTLIAYDTDTNKVFLRWLAVGNDSLTGRADHYDLRYSTVNITEANWSSATQASGEPTPKTSGSYDSLTISGLTSDTQYYFALKVYDDTTGVSSLSNVATARTDTVSVTPLAPGYPNAVSTLAVDSTNSSSLFLSWTATGDDGSVGTATTYDVRYSTRKPSTGELLTNGTFDANVNGWQLVNEFGVLAWDASHGRVSGGALKLTNTASYSGVVFPISNTDADSATVSFWAYCTYKDTIDLYILDQNNGIIGSSQQKIIQAGTWTYVTRTVKLTGLQTQIRPGFNFDPGITGNQIWIDDASCTVGVSWTALTQATGEPSPSISGTLEHFTLTGLSSNTLYYAALKVIDDSSNTSGLSNVVSGTTATNVNPPVVPDSSETKPLITSGSIWVGKHGSNSNTGVDSLHAYLTISKAVSVASAGDTIVVLSGTYAEKVRVTAQGTETEPIVLAAYGNQVVTISGSSSASEGNCMYVEDADWWVFHGLTFQDQTRATSNSAYYWVVSTGYHNTIRWCRFTGEPNAVDNRLLYFNGKFTTVRNSFFRGGYQGIVLDGSAPRYYLLHRDTVYNSYMNNIILGGAGGVVGVNHAGLVQYCVLDTANEDNIQFQNNGTAELSNNGVIIRYNFLSNAQENCIDMKSCGPTVAIEDNTLVNSYGNDTDGGNDDSGGAGIELGAGDVCRYGIVRFNLIGGNHTGSKMYPGFHIFNNTFYNNSHSYRGFNSTSGTYSGLETDNVSESGEMKRLINNIFYDEAGASNRAHAEIIKANNTYFEINNNLYYQSGGSIRLITNYPDPWPTNTTYTSLSSWQTGLNSMGSWIGKDAASIESDPLFVDVPSNPGAYDASWDFNIGDASPAKSAAKAWTLTTNTGNNSTSLTVSDPYFFRTDYGIPLFYSGIKGDSIQIGSASPVEITAINYSTSTLTISSQRTWSNGAEVWLWKDGKRVDDIGAKQASDAASSMIFNPGWFNYSIEYGYYPLGDFQATHADDRANGFMSLGTQMDDDISDFISSNNLWYYHYWPADSTITALMGVYTGHATISDANTQVQYNTLDSLGALETPRVFWALMSEYDQSGGNWANQRSLTYTTRATAYSTFQTALENNYAPLYSYLQTARNARDVNYMAVCVYGFNAPFFYRNGVDLVLMEICNSETGDIQTTTAMTRGAARMFNKPWGFDISTWKTATNSATSYADDGYLYEGWSSSYHRRHLYLGYMSGANAILHEATDWTNGSTSTLCSLGVVANEVKDFSVTRHPDPGVTEVKTAIMLATDNGFVPKHSLYVQGNTVWYQNIAYADGDYMEHEFFDLAFPRYYNTGTEPDSAPSGESAYRAALASHEDSRPWEPMGRSRWGDQFDVITSECPVSVLNEYENVILMGNIVLTDELRDNLDAFVLAGGKVVVNIEQARASDSTWLGVRNTNSSKTSTQSYWLADGSPVTEKSYTYDSLVLKTATTIARSNTNAPIVTRRQYGDGYIYTVAPSYGINTAKDTMLIVMGRLIDDLQSNVSATVSGPFLIEYMVNSSTGAVIVTLVNNEASSWSGTVTLSGTRTATSASEWVHDSALSVSGGNSVSITVAPYDVKVVAFSGVTQ